MSNRRRTRVERAERKQLRCPKCRSLDIDTKEYDDALLHICRGCEYPRRVVKP